MTQLYHNILDYPMWKLERNSFKCSLSKYPYLKSVNYSLIRFIKNLSIVKFFLIYIIIS